MSSFTNTTNFDNLMLQTLMGRLQIRPPTNNSFLSQTLEELLFDAANLSDDDDDENKTQLAKEESRLEKEIIRVVLSGKTDSLKPNSGQAVTIGEHHICVGFHEESGSDYRVWEWHGHIMLFDEENGYTPEYIYGNYFERLIGKARGSGGGGSGGVREEERSCSKFENFPEILEPMEHLKSLSLIQTAVRELPSSICKLKYLESLYLTNCYRFSKFPEILKPMEHLVSLCLEETAVEMLPSSIGNLNGLQDLNLSRCYLLKDVPTSIYSLTNLKRLNFNDCRRLEKLPSCSVGFFSLEELDLSNSGILEIPASIKQASRLSILDLINCKWLQSIPELPVLCNVKASNSTSLKIVSSSRTALAQGWDKPNYCFKVFTNCPKLDNNSGSNIMDEAQITIMRMATVAPLEDYWLPCNPWPQINIACPGKEIPNWFSYQNEGSSVDIELCPDWFRTGLFGFALSVVVSPCQDYFIRLRANFIVKFRGESHELFNSQYIIPCNSYNYDCDGQQHVLVWNEAFRSEEVGKNCSPDVYKLAKEASVVFYPQDFASHMKVESCGICPLYAEDAEKFKFGHVFPDKGGGGGRQVVDSRHSMITSNPYENESRTKSR